MKHTCQKLLAGFLAASVMISLCVISAFADDTASPTLDTGASSAPSPQVMGVARVISETLRIRTSADLGGTVLGLASRNVIVAVYGQSGEWNHIAYNGMDGYVYGDFISYTESAHNLTTAAGKVTASDVTLRTAASDQAAPLATVAQSTPLYVTGFQSGWYQIAYAGYIGYVPSASLMLTDPSAAGSVTYGVVNDSEVRLRSGAGTDTDVITFLDKNSIMTVAETLDGWYRVTTGTAAGYIASNFLSVLPTALTVSSTGTVAVGRVLDPEVLLRSAPAADADSLAVPGAGALVSILRSQDGWYLVNSEGQEGYISANYISAQTAVYGLSTYGKLTDDATLRTQPSGGSDALTKISGGSYVDVSGFVGGWYLVTYDGHTGYVTGDSLYMTSVREVPAVPAVAASSSSSSAAAPSSSLPSGASAGSGSYGSVVSLAQSFLGVSYVYGGASPSGFDCSGFTMYVFAQFGYGLPHGATGQLNYGSVVSQSDLQPGDLVFFQDYNYSYSAASHVGIYIGGGQFIHASSSSNSYCVTISSLGESYYASHYLTGRRL